MRYFETKEQRPERVLSYEDTKTFQYKLLRFFALVFILGFATMFVGWIYRKVWANYRIVQTYGAAAGLLGWFGFLAMCHHFGLSIKKMSYNRVKSILKNETVQSSDLEQITRKQIYNTLYKKGDEWTLYPAVYKGNPDKHINAVLVGPGGIYAINMVLQDPKDKKKFVDPVKALIPGTEAMSQKINEDVRMLVIIRKHTRKYQITDERIHLFTFQELYSYISNREPIYTEEEVEQINKKVAMLTNADTTVRVE